MNAPPEPSALPPFADIFRQYGPFAWRVLRRLGVAPGDVEDVCQEVFLVVHRKLGEFEGRSSLRTWIFGVCVRAASDYRKRASRREQPTEEMPEQSVPATQDAHLDARYARDRLDAALMRLDEDKRAVFVLYEIEELTMSEVAQAVGCPLQTAYSRLHAARAQVESFFRKNATVRVSP